MGHRLFLILAWDAMPLVGLLFSQKLPSLPKLQPLIGQVMEGAMKALWSGKQVIAEESDHMIPLNQPQIIVDSIKEMVESSRNINKKSEGNCNG